MLFKHFFKWSVKPVNKIINNDIIRVPVLFQDESEKTVHKMPFLYKNNKLELLDELNLKPLNQEYKFPYKISVPIDDYYIYNVLTDEFKKKLIYDELKNIEILEKINLKDDG